MSKKLPLLRRLDVALAETSSDSEVDCIYGLLGRYVKDSKDVSRDEFYSNLDYRTLSVIENRRSVSIDDIVAGRNIAEFLKSSVNLPKPGTKGYRDKMIQAMNFEYERINEFYSI